MKHLFLACCLPGLALAGEPSPQAKQEIAHLMDHLKQSNCQFNRNGSWHTSNAAADHLNEKYQYLLKKGLVSSTEDFIERAGTQSSMSGKPYQVRCQAQAATPSAAWLRAELTRYRAASQSKAP